MTNDYPYSLDSHLKQAMKLAIAHGDEATAKRIWEIFVSYRKSVPTQNQDARISSGNGHLPLV